MKTISISLATNIAYVTGTVNNKDYTFTLLEVRETSSVWTAEVERANPDVYHCSITAIDTSGQTTSFDTTLYYGLNLITDRTISDVEQIKSLNESGFASWTDEEKEQYLADLKGAYNVSDLNRVEAAVAYVMERFIAIGYDARILDIKNTWIRTEFMTLSDTVRYLDNIRYLASQFVMPEGTPDVPTDMNGFTYSEANDIERILEIVDEYITKIMQGYLYSGELYGGEI